jgi:hypothetical protein
MIKTLIYCTITIIIIGFWSCEDSSDKGKVSFATNTGIVNCPIDALLYVDYVNFGVIPDVGDSTIECSSSANLNLQLPVGIHKFSVIVVSSDGSCKADTSGTINVLKDQCTPVFVDIRKLLK